MLEELDELVELVEELLPDELPEEPLPEEPLPEASEDPPVEPLALDDPLPEDPDPRESVR